MKSSLDSLLHRGSSSTSETIPSESETSLEMFEREREALILGVIEMEGRRSRVGLPEEDDEAGASRIVRDYEISTNNRDGVPPILSFPLSVIEKHLPEAERKRLLAKVPLKQAETQERFDLVRGVLEQTTPIDRMYVRIRAKAFPSLFKDFNVTLEELVSDGRIRSATDLVSARELILGRLSIDDDVRTSFEVAREQQKPKLLAREYIKQPGEENGVALPDTLLQFYANEHIRAAVSVLKTATDFNSRAPSTLKMALMRVEDGMRMETQQTVKRVRRYLLHAIATELYYQKPKGLTYYKRETKSSYSSGVAGKTFYNALTDKEDVLNYLRAAHGRFLEGYRGMSGYGGELWSQIADAAYDLWATDDSKELVPLLDRVFQLEHNTDTVFDKDTQQFSSVDLGKEMLDNKFEAKDLGDLLHRSRALLKSDPDMQRRVQVRIDGVKALFRLARVYFPDKVSSAEEQLNIPSGEELPA